MVGNPVNKIFSHSTNRGFFYSSISILFALALNSFTIEFSGTVFMHYIRWIRRVSECINATVNVSRGEVKISCLERNSREIVSKRSSRNRSKSRCKSPVSLTSKRETIADVSGKMRWRKTKVCTRWNCIRMRKKVETKNIIQKYQKNEWSEINVRWSSRSTSLLFSLCV